MERLSVFLYDGDNSRKWQIDPAGLANTTSCLSETGFMKGGATMKEFILGLLMGIGLLVFAFWRLETRNLGTSGCLLPFIFGVIVLHVMFRGHNCVE
jgi:hypothetical protein